MESWDFKYIRCGDADYEKARRGAVWNGRVPDRYPELIVYPQQDSHVQSIVLYARGHGMTIGTKSGGHSWTASQRIAVAQPAAYGYDLNAALVPHNVMFPGGHCPTVALGGFLLQGGFGWNSRKWGVACESVLAIDVVTAEGELIHASAQEHTDFFWAARGAGCGYFAQVKSPSLLMDMSKER